VENANIQNTNKMIFEIVLYTLMIVFVVFAVKAKDISDFFGKIFLKKIKTFNLLSNSVKYTLFLLIAAVAIGGIAQLLGMSEDVGLVAEVIKQMQFAEVLVLVFFAGIAEEVLFRGYLTPKTNMWISSFLFAIAHAGYGSMTEIIGAFALGCILAYQFKKSKNLWPVILTHILYDIIVVIAIFSV